MNIFNHPSKYQIGLKTATKSYDFIFDCVHLLYYKCNKIDFKRGLSYIDSPGWIKKQKINNKYHQQKI